jgi:hypothetical protein
VCKFLSYSLISLIDKLKLTVNEKRAGGYGETQIVSVSLPIAVLEQMEQHRRYDSRSRYILRAVEHYIEVEEEMRILKEKRLKNE